MGVYNVDYNNQYDYHISNPFAVKCVFNNGSSTCFDWDAYGNMACIVGGTPFPEQRLCWTEDNRLQGYKEFSEENGRIAAYYNYGANGERYYKLTSPHINISQNAYYSQSIPLEYPTLYASAFITINRGVYTKHYFEGSNYICGKIGGGFRFTGMAAIDSRTPEIETNHEEQYGWQKEGILHTFEKCSMGGVDMTKHFDLHEVMMREVNRDEPEPAYFYHSDHLGSAAYLTCQGSVVQTLNYLPYGEDWVEHNTFSTADTSRLGIIPYEPLRLGLESRCKSEMVAKKNRDMPAFMSESRRSHVGFKRDKNVLWAFVPSLTSFPHVVEAGEAWGKCM